VSINLKKPSCHNVSCDHHTLYSLGGVRVPDFEIWPVIDYRDQHMRANALEGIRKELKVIKHTASFSSVLIACRNCMILVFMWPLIRSCKKLNSSFVDLKYIS